MKQETTDRSASGDVRGGQSSVNAAHGRGRQEGPLMLKSVTRLSVFALAMAFALPVSAQDTPSSDTVIVSVNGTDITLGHMILMRNSLPEQYQRLSDDVLWDAILDQLIGQTLLSMDDAAVETKRVKLSLENEQRALLAAEAAASVAEAAVSDDTLQAAYDAKYANADLGLEYNASHILVDSEEEAQAIADEVNAGADFAAVAREKSTGPSGPNGGALGWFAAGMMVEPFQAAVEKLEVGQVSAPVKTQFGWHVIKLNETRQKAAPALDSVRAELADELQRAALTEKLDMLKSGATIVNGAEGIDKAQLRNLDLLED
ncbi:peptidylprolyl isomerase [Mesobacterium sp. TK19101]|uniref:Parvulin-like PPIase n=2 Tax=Mesobacterium hydrothermale TaxID=3111907 RepID=A0ABU6HIF2_9RHOB|nr:peptidylprolyl isomerase [Mesobacterium sp. TK19101]